MFMLLLICLIDYTDRHPYPEVAAMALDNLEASRRLFSDQPDRYREPWSKILEGPCPGVLTGPGFSPPFPTPCSIYPFFPDFTDLQLPAAVVTGYQHLTYTPPKSASSTKASLALSWEYTLISAGAIWTMTVTAEGVKHDVWVAEYRKFDKRLELFPFVYITVQILRPRIYHHLTVNPNGEFNLQTHDIRVWETPLSLFQLGLMYDVWPETPTCGTPGYVYTSKPGELLQDLVRQFHPEAGELVDGDRTIIVTPPLGFKDCGEYSYPAFHQFMTHRPAPGPSLFAEGPPMEVWHYQGVRDISEPNRQVLDPDAPLASKHMRALRDDLEALGISGELTQDPAMANSLRFQEVANDYSYVGGHQRVETAMMVTELLQANPSNDHLWELFNRTIAPNLAHLERMHDTEIEFDPYAPHCTRGFAYPGHIPILGQHYYTETRPCRSCGYHDRIVNEPRRGWSHKRLIYVDWIWEPIHGARGNIREHAFAFIRDILYDQAGTPQASIRDLQTELVTRQRTEVQRGQVPATAYASLEQSPNGEAPNPVTAQDQANVPGFFRRPFEPCMDPSYTIQYLFLYGEILDILDSPCGLLWEVGL